MVQLPKGPWSNNTWELRHFRGVFCERFKPNRIWVSGYGCVELCADGHQFLKLGCLHCEWWGRGVVGLMDGGCIMLELAHFFLKNIGRALGIFATYQSNGMMLQEKMQLSRSGIRREKSQFERLWDFNVVKLFGGSGKWNSMNVNHWFVDVHLASVLKEWS